MNGATDCDENDGDGDDNVTMWGVGDFSDMEIVADEDDDVDSEGDGAGGGKGQYIPKKFIQGDINKKKQDIFQGNEVMDGMVNWENSSSDGDRFSITEYRKKSKELV